MRQLKTFQDPQLPDIYKNKKLRNAIARAHGCYDANHNFKHYAALLYPIEYIVTKEHMKAAREEKERHRQEIIEHQGQQLWFVSMTPELDHYPKDEVKSGRFRAEFINRAGEQFMVEFIKNGLTDSLYVTHAVNLQTGEDDPYRINDMIVTPHYDLVHAMGIINIFFNCHFTSAVIDYYTLSPGDIVSVSPK